MAKISAKTSAKTSAKISAKPDFARLPKDVAPEALAALRASLLTDTRAAKSPPASGWRILAKRVLRPHAKIDLVAKRRRLLAFVEVKACATLDDAAVAATPRQEARIIDVARARLVAHPAHGDFELRFEAILIAPHPLPRHLLAAFGASSRTHTPGIRR